MPGARKIGAAISGPRVAGRKMTDTRQFQDLSKSFNPNMYGNVLDGWRRPQGRFRVREAGSLIR